MANPSQHSASIRRRVGQESGNQFTAGACRVAMAYPSPYRAGMSSLGFQWILTLLRRNGIAAERVFLPDDLATYRDAKPEPLSYESMTPLRRFPLVLVSLAYELEIAGLIQLLELAGIPPKREDRGRYDPMILLGGPLTFSNPLPAAPFVDAMLMGEADDTVVPAVQAFFDTEHPDTWLNTIGTLPGGFVPSRDGERLPSIAKADDASLPAHSCILAPEAALSGMFLVEGERGCHRQCTFCVMRRSTNGGMRLFDQTGIIEMVPERARKVGLVGAAISDHPKLVPMLDALVASGRQVSVSSLRADRVALKPDIPRLLSESGARTLTVALDAASQRLRRAIVKGTVERHLIRCAELAAEHQFKVLKVYMMVGLPDETDDDIDELVVFMRALSKIAPIAIGVAPFVAKRATPLDGTSFAGIKVIERRLQRLKRGLQGRAEVRPTSARWAWVEYQLAQGGPEAGLAVLDALHQGGRFAHYRDAFQTRNTERARPEQMTLLT